MAGLGDAFGTHSRKVAGVNPTVVISKAAGLAFAFVPDSGARRETFSGRASERPVPDPVALETGPAPAQMIAVPNAPALWYFVFRSFNCPF